MAERLWAGSHGVGAALDEVTPRLAVHACQMKMRGFAISPYSPSTFTMSGASFTHKTMWDAGGG